MNCPFQSFVLLYERVFRAGLQMCKQRGLAHLHVLTPGLYFCRGGAWHVWRA